jgi:NSS family neurotransmitter:Na+ symporter
MAEWALGRHTRRGTVGAFARAGLPFGRQVGWFFFAIILAATSYYSVAVGWVLCFALAEAGAVVGLGWNAAAVLPPAAGFVAQSFLLELGFTAAVILGAAFVLARGLRGGIEVASRYLIPALFVILLVLIARSVTLPGAMDGVRWYLFKFRMSDVTGTVVVAALGQAAFSIGLGGTFMVVYGSYLRDDEPLARGAVWTASSDTAAGLLAGLAIFPAVFALGMEPGSGPRLIFDTLPQVFAAMPAGRVFAFLFYIALFFGALLSVIAALEVAIAGLTDNTRLGRRAAVWITAGIALTLSIPPMINMEIFVPWDLTFGSGMQTLGALFAVVTVGWALKRSSALAALSQGGRPAPRWLYYWLRFVVPGGILLAGVWWLLTDVLRVAGGV